MPFCEVATFVAASAAMTAERNKLRETIMGGLWKCEPPGGPGGWNIVVVSLRETNPHAEPTRSAGTPDYDKVRHSV
jgi:hypothetical protein